MLRKICIIFFLFCLATGWSQNTPISQYYGSPLLLNPGLTGQTEAFRFGMVYRGQVANGSFGNLSNVFYVDYNVPNNGLGIGIMIDQLVQTGLNVRSTYLSAMAAYEVKLNDSWVFRPGISLSYGRRDINYSSNSYYIPYSPSQSVNPDNVSYFNTTAGFLINDQNFWFGTTFYNLNEADISVFSDVDDNLQMVYNIHTGYRYTLNDGPTDMEKQYVSLALNYVNNPNIRSSYTNTTIPTDQLDFGLYYTAGIGQVGLWYRGTSLKNENPSITDPRDMVLMGGINSNGFYFGYSYQFRVRGTGAANFHELMLSYNFGGAVPGSFTPPKSPLPWI